MDLEIRIDRDRQQKSQAKVVSVVTTFTKTIIIDFGLDKLTQRMNTCLRSKW